MMVDDQKDRVLTHWRDRPIVGRYPYAQPGETVIGLSATNPVTVEQMMFTTPVSALPAAGEILLAAYGHAEERPFEIQDLVFDVTPATTDDSGLICDPVFAQQMYFNGQSVLDAYVVVVVTKDEDRGGQVFLRVPTRATLNYNPETGVWQFQRPWVVEAGQGILIMVRADVITFTLSRVIPAGEGTETINFFGSQLRIAITARGELIEVG